MDDIKATNVVVLRGVVDEISASILKEWR